MRLVALVLALLLALPIVRAQPGAPAVTMTIEVQPDHREAMTLDFTGLQRLARYTDLCLPLGATVVAVHDSLGPAPYDANEDAAGRQSISFTARDSQLTVTLQRAAPAASDTAPFYESNANFCVPQESALAVVVKMPAGHTLFFLGRGGQIAPDGSSGRIDTVGPVHAFYSYEGPLPGGLALVEETPFRIATAAGSEAQAREVARDAAPALAAALREAGLAMPAPLLRVRYAPTTSFTWEAGHYDGHGLITIKQSSLTPDRTEGYPYVPAKVLVHESFHAASAWGGRGDVEDAIDWFLEGSARHAERFVDGVLPNATYYCEKSATRVQCWSFDDRISQQQLAQAYDGSYHFTTAWDPAAQQGDDARQLTYAYGGYVVGAYVERDGAASYQKAWRAVEAAFQNGTGCPCGGGWLLGALVNATEGKDTREEILSPWSAQSAQGRLASARDLLRDESGMQRELDAASHVSFLPVPGVGPVGLAAALSVALALRRLRRA